MTDTIESDAELSDSERRNSPRERKVAWPRYLEAELGFRNHWYPVFFGVELEEADLSDSHGAEVTQVRAEVILGERILFRRVEGKVLAVEDRCRHRGVALSARPECYTRDSITCWYHGFTYRLDDGALATILTDPESPLIRKIGLRTYPTEERAGIVWVFIGDADPHPLELDVPPSLFDKTLTIAPRGWSEVVEANWRIAVENAFDPGHAYLHRNAGLVVRHRVPTVLGSTNFKMDDGMEVVDDEGGPVGVRMRRGTATPVWEADAGEGVTVAARYRPGEEGVLEGMVPDVSVWLPSGVEVDPFPAPGLMQFEWFVPVDRYRHRYMMTWGKRDCSEEQRAAFINEIESVWRHEVPQEFNHDDVFAREKMAEFYDRGEGWSQERLYGPDLVITNWRKLASRRGGTIQTDAHAWASRPADS